VIDGALRICKVSSAPAMHRKKPLESSCLEVLEEQMIRHQRFLFLVVFRVEQLQSLENNLFGCRIILLLIRNLFISHHGNDSQKLQT
jgi:hypothetical protein